MSKIKWKYIKERDSYHTETGNFNGSVWSPYFVIHKQITRKKKVFFSMRIDGKMHDFKKLSSAKQVAELLRHG